MTTPVVDLDQLSNIVGPESVLTGVGLADYAIDGVSPMAVVCPNNRAQVGDVLRWACARGATVFTRGGGTKTVLGNRPSRVDVVLDLRRLCRVLDYQPADMTVTVEAGITLAALQEELAAAGQFVPLEAPFPEQATIGGILASGSTGPLAHAYGPPRDWLIGIGVVGADGVASKAGGKVVKNVTGYDLNKLYTGSLGTLGIIVEATFKVSPLQPENTAMLALFPTLESAISAGTTLLNTPAAPLAYVAASPERGRTGPAAYPSKNSSEYPAAFPEESGRTASHLTNPAGIAFFSDRPNATRRRTEAADAALKQAGATEVSPLDGTQAGAMRRWLIDLGWEPLAPPALAIKLVAPRRSIASLASACLEVGATRLVADPGFGVLRLFWWENPGDETMRRSIEIARRAARTHGGKAVVEQCPGSIKAEIDVWDEEPDSMEIMRRIKAQYLALLPWLMNGNYVLALVLCTRSWINGRAVTREETAAIREVN